MKAIRHEQTIVKHILLMPIEIVNGKSYIENGVIYSDCHYRSEVGDPDMCDVAIGFYKILYGKSMLNSDNKIGDVDFAGDTMNSFNSIANLVPGAGTSKGARTCMEFWPEWLRHYFFRYHCLANFWAIPFKDGRKSRKGNNLDSPIIYMRCCSNQLSNAREHFTNCYKEFIDSWPKEKGDLTKFATLKKYILENPDCLWELIEARAAEISANETKAHKLYEYFCECFGEDVISSLIPATSVE